MVKQNNAIPDAGALGVSDTRQAAYFSTISLAKRPPAKWDQADPYVANVIGHIRQARSFRTAYADRQLLSYLIGIAEGNGQLPRGHKQEEGLNYAAVCRASGVPRNTMSLTHQLRATLDFWSRRLLLAPNCDEFIAARHRGGDGDPIKAYIEQKAAAGEGVPAHTGGRRISVAGVAAETGLGHATLARSAHCLQKLRTALDNGVIVLGPVWKPAKPSKADEARLAGLMKVVAGFDVEGGSIPGHFRHKGRPDFEYIAELTGTCLPTMEDNYAYNAYVRDVAKRRGIAPRDTASPATSVLSVRDYICAQVEADQKKKGLVSWRTGVANHKTAFDKLMGALGLTIHDDVGEMLRADFEKGLLAVKASASNPDTARTLAGQIVHIKHLEERRTGLEEVPKGYREAIRFLVKRMPITYAALGRAVGTDGPSIRAWVEDNRGVSLSSKHIIDKIETFFNLPAGDLSADISFGQVNRRATGDAAGAVGIIPRGLHKHLPADVAYWSEPRREAAIGLVEPLLKAGTEYGRLCSLSRLEENRFDPLDATPRLLEQFEDFVAYKQAPIPYPLLRAPKGRWASTATETIRMPPLKMFFRFTAAPLGDGGNSGYGLSSDDATMAWLAVPAMTLGFVAHRSRRFEDMSWRGERRGVFYTAAEIQFVEFCASVTNPVTGYLAQHPEMAAQIMPQRQVLPAAYSDLLSLYVKDADRELVTDDDAASARSDWRLFCERAHECYLQAISYLRENVGVSRSPMDPISGLVMAAEPLSELMVLGYKAQRRWAAERTAPSSYRNDVRDSVLDRLGQILSFRPKNLALLSYTGDSLGQIAKVDGAWVVEVYWKLFKNHKNCDLFGPPSARRNFRMILDDEAGLYDLLDLYFFGVLPSFSRPTGSNAAFYTARGAALSETSLGQIVRQYASVHVAWNPVLATGFPDVTSMSPYSYRHVKATHELKNSLAINRIREAAFAIQTSEKMISQHYGFVFPEQALVGSQETTSRAIASALKMLG